MNGPGDTPEAREQWLNANADRWPTYAERIADLQRLIQQAHAIVDRPIDPDTYPQGINGHPAEAGFEVVGFNLDAALRELGQLAGLTTAGVIVPGRMALLNLNRTGREPGA
jgi:hypothetical protein